MRGLQDTATPPALVPVRRDRHGRGLRGALVPSGIPLARSRAETFDEIVIAAVEQIDKKWRNHLSKVEFAVEDVPSLDDWAHDWVPLARVFASTGALPARVVVFRRPLETRATNLEQLHVLVMRVIVEHVAELLGVDPGDVATSP